MLTFTLFGSNRESAGAGLTDSRVVVVGVIQAQNGFDARIAATADPADLFSTWRRRQIVFAPVVAHRIEDVDVFSANILRLPTTIPLFRAAELLHRLPIDREFRQLCYSSIRQLGSQGGLLLSEWAKAARVAL